MLHDYLAELTESCPDMQEGISRVGCWMFHSSGKSVVHCHSDPDQSCLKQIRGSKTVFVYPSGVLPQSAIDELVYTDDQKAVTYSPEYEAHMFPIAHQPWRGGLLAVVFAAPRDERLRRQRLVRAKNKVVRTVGRKPSCSEASL